MTTITISSRSLTRLTLLAGTLLLVSAICGPAAAAKTCMTCHANGSGKKTWSSRGVKLNLKAFARSVHKDLDCTDCHTQLADAEPGKVHNPKVGPPSCYCHEEATKIYKGSVHGKAKARGDREVARCGDCHGAHDIRPVKDHRSRVFKLQLPMTCARCHKKAGLAKRHKIKRPMAAQHYAESIHGKSLIKNGLIVAPSCTDCHGGHDIQRHTDPRSLIHHDKVPATCGKCHKGIQKIFDRSVHGKMVDEHTGRGPVCIDCHTAHEISKPGTGVFKLKSDERCGRCHADRLKRYRETYHGRAIALGMSKVAACYDCHGHHDVQPASNPESKLSAKNQLATCRQCHPTAGPNFAGYMAHGDHSDKQNYPLLYWVYVCMTALLMSVFAFFGVHTLLWFVRSAVLLIRNPAAFSEARRKVREEKEGRIYVRFRPVDRFCHFLVIISFLLLTVTGMPLKFYYAEWAKWMFSWMGGAEVAAALHRLGAVITLIYFSVHLLSMASALWRRRGDLRNKEGRLSLRHCLGLFFGPDSPVPNWQDIKDFWAHQMWFFGRGPRPQFDRWTYWEKFDYLAVFWGIAIIGLSGLVMWFPETFTLFLPGWVINIAHVVHSDEALLASGFIFTFHFFNVHFRIEKFPMDPVIFSGRITEEEMKHERGRLYDRLKESGRLDDERLTDEWGRWKKIFTPIGMAAFALGVVLILAIYWAMASRMLHG